MAMQQFFLRFSRFSLAIRTIESNRAHNSFLQTIPPKLPGITSVDTWLCVPLFINILSATLCSEHLRLIRFVISYYKMFHNDEL